MVQLVITIPVNSLMELDCYRNGLIIWYKNAFDEVQTPSFWTRDFGINIPPGTGIYIWEGDLSDPNNGSWRSPSDAEWDLIKQNLNPFD